MSVRDGSVALAQRRIEDQHGTGVNRSIRTPQRVDVSLRSLRKWRDYAAGR